MALRKVGNSSTLKRILSGALGGGSDALNLQALLGGEAPPETGDPTPIGPATFGPAAFEPTIPSDDDTQVSAQFDVGPPSTVPTAGDELTLEQILAILAGRLGG